MFTGRTRAGLLFDCWAQVSRRVQAAEFLVLFLDFDGTLVPLCARPEDVRLSVATRRVLRRLARHPRIILVILSGRRRAELIKHVDAPRAQYLGLYGWERRQESALPRKPQWLVSRAQEALIPSLGKRPGVWIEDKVFTFAVHYRGAPPKAVRRARTIVRGVLRWFAPDLRLLRGNKAWEVVPCEVQGKGEAVRGMLRRIPRPCLAIYVGDDKSDEAAFAVLRWGITVQVGRARRTKARYRLRNPDEVRIFLERLEVELS